MKRFYSIVSLLLCILLPLANLVQAAPSAKATEGFTPAGFARGGAADVTAQQVKPKYRPAPTSMKNIKDDEFCITLKRELSEDEFKGAVDRILNTYQAKPLPSDSGLDGQAIYVGQRCACLRVNERIARRIADREESVEAVEQDYEVPAFSDPITPIPVPHGALRSGKLRERQINDNQSLQRHNDEAQTLRIESAEPNRATTYYHLDRDDSVPRIYNGAYTPTNDGLNVDIYFFDTGINVTHSEFGSPTRAFMLHNYFSSESYFNEPPDHGTSVASAAIGVNTGVANQARAYMTRVLRDFGNPNANPAISTTQWVEALNRVRNTIISRRPRAAVVNFSLRYPDSATTIGMQNALADIMSPSGANTPVVAAIGQVGTFTNPGPVTRADWWPQNEPGVVTVGATDSDDERVDYGYTVGPFLYQFNQFSGSDIFAPAGPRWFGTNHTVDQDGVWVAHSFNGTALRTGSSFAAPQAAGVMAMYYAVNTTYVAPVSYAKSWLFDQSTQGAVLPFSLSTGDSNRLVYAKAPVLASRNGASFIEGSSPDSFAAGFANFGVFGLNANRIDFRNGTTTLASVTPSFADSGQVNFYVPSSLPTGILEVKAYNGSALLASGAIALANINPGLQYTTNGYAAAVLYKADKVTGIITNEQVSPDGNTWNPATHAAFLVLFGTGWRTSAGPNVVQFKKDNTIYSSETDFQMFYFGPAADAGQDQINLGPLPEAMGNNKGIHDIKLYIQGFPSPPGLLANIVKFQVK